MKRKRTFLVCIILAAVFGMGMLLVLQQFIKHNLIVTWSSDKMVEYEQTEKTVNESVIKLYHKFLLGDAYVGNISIDDIITSDNKLDGRKLTNYALFDSNGDKIPELHIKAGRDYYVLSVLDETLYVWKNFNTSSYDYIIYDYLGDEVWALNFKVRSNYENKEDKYYFANVEVTKEQWEELTEQFLCVDESGRCRVCNEIEWTELR